MTAAFLLGAFLLKLQIGLAMMLGALVGAIVGGSLFPLSDLVRHLAEGTFAYFDPILMIATAMIFMFSIERNGLLRTLSNATIRALFRAPALLLVAITVIIMMPGMLTGSSTAGVLTTGAIMAPVLMGMGIPRAKAGAIIAMAALFGMVAPPVNVPALIIAAGVDLPYVGLDLPLLVLTLPLAIGTTLWLGLPHCWRAEKQMPEILSIEGANRRGPLMFLPLVVVVGLLATERIAPGIVDLGLPMIFVLGAAIACCTGAKFNVLEASRDAMRTAMPILGILMGVGMFIQIMTLTGARGEVVIQALQLPRGWTGLYPMIGITMPLFGAVSSFGAASVLGVPFVMALPTSSGVIVMNTASLSVIVGLGDLMPPTALAGLFAAQVVGEKDYMKVLRWCLLPGIATCVVGLLAIQYAAPLSAILVQGGP